MKLLPETIISLPMKIIRKNIRRRTIMQGPNQYKICHKSLKEFDLAYPIDFPVATHDIWFHSFVHFVQPTGNLLYP